MENSNELLKVLTNASLPNYGSDSSAGLDIYSSNIEDILIEPGKIVPVPTNLAIEIPEGFFGAIYPRSSTGVKKNLMLANTVGIIDSDYRGEIKIFFYNFGEEAQVIKNNDRLAQLVIQPYNRVNVLKVDELSQTDRGEGGFGSTGR